MTALKLNIALALMLTAGAAFADDNAYEITGDAEKGAKVFRKCRACHAVGEDAANKVGPVLNGVVGRQMGSAADFDYSDDVAAKGAEGMVWDPEALDAFLTKPKDYFKKTKMAFAGLRKDADRENVIAYLASFNEDGTAAQ